MKASEMQRDELAAFLETDEGRAFLDRLGIVRIPQDQVTLHPFLLGRKFQKAADKAVLRKNGVSEQKNSEK